MPTYVLIAANVAIYVFTAYLSGNALEMSDSVLLQYGQYNPYILYNAEYWRLFTGMFVHANIAHIVGNMLFLFIYGLRAEDLFDLKEYLGIYLLSGLAGGLLTLFLWPDSLSVGASGAIFGMIGACTIYLARARVATVGWSIITALMYVFFLFAFNFGPNVNYLAHLGGLAVGLFMGYILAATRKSARPVTYEFKYPSSYQG